MGLAGPRVRHQIGSDPRNTAWSTDESRFGHQLLLKQGWKRGRGLGYTRHGNAHSVAESVRWRSNSDTLGLGVKQNTSSTQLWDGLAGFNAIFSRLHGRKDDFSDAILKTHDRAAEDGVGEGACQLARRHLKSVALARKFIYGGLLQRQRMQRHLINDSTERQKAESDDKCEKREQRGDKLEKRKREKGDRSEKREKRKNRKDRKKRKGHDEGSAADNNESTRRSKKQKDKESLLTDPEGSEKIKKLKRKRERSEQKSSELGQDSATIDREETRESSDQKNSQQNAEFANAAAADVAPVEATAATAALHARHMARRKYILQKQQSRYDQTAMSEILGIRPAKANDKT